MIEQIENGLAHPVPTITPRQAFPGPVELQEAAFGVLAENRRRIELDQVLGQFHLIGQGARGPFGDLLGALARPRQQTNQEKDQEGTKRTEQRNGAGHRSAKLLLQGRGRFETHCPAALAGLQGADACEGSRTCPGCAFAIQMAAPWRVIAYRRSYTGSSGKPGATDDFVDSKKQVGNADAPRSALERQDHHRAGGRVGSRGSANEYGLSAPLGPCERLGAGTIRKQVVPQLRPNGRAHRLEQEYRRQSLATGA